MIQVLLTVDIMIYMKQSNIFPVLALTLLLGINTLAAQEIKEKQDTLQTITVTADSSVVRPAGLTQVDLPRMQQMVTALGEGDVIKYIQTVPGIAVGVEGTSSFYVRGGNLGNNVVTVDGVRLYGYGHLLGLTSAFSNDIVGNANFSVGGFSAESYNLLASHIEITTKEPDFKHYNFKFGVSNFMVSSYASGPIKNQKLAFEVAARVSPLSWEYKIGKDWIDDKLDIFNNLSASVYDVFAKISYKPGKRHTINASFFYSLDNFGYGEIDVSSYDKMRWHNIIGNLEWKCRLSNNWNVKTNFSFNHYKSGQTQERVLEGVYNKLTVKSLIQEMTFNTLFQHSFSKRWSMKYGLRVTKSTFNPGSSKVDEMRETKNETDNILGNLYTELNYNNADKLKFSLAVRGNYFIGEKGSSDEHKVFDPEVSFSASARLTGWMGIEATFDRLVQYYHTLEGIPLGWSLDMIVPSSKKLRPERGMQYYGGFYFKVAQNHRFSIGAYYKKMENLIHFEKASDFFDQTLSGWKEFIKIGEGKSKGIEFLYQKSGERLNWKAAYTYSKTTRFFPELNDGKVFRAKFDRPHIFNLSADYIILSNAKREYGANLLFSYQSGNLESVKSGHYPSMIPGIDITLDYYGGLNNLRLDYYMRVDIGAYAKWKRPKATHNLQVGIYNLTNRHNIFSLYYDEKEDIWKKVYVFPIMPSISYKVEF